MRKLTKRVNAWGLWFDVPRNTSHISVDKYGVVKSHEAEPVIIGVNHWICLAVGAVDEIVSSVELDDEDWRECCWFVGDQVKGEYVERRAWMVAGVTLLFDMVENSVGPLGSVVVSAIYKLKQVLSSEISAGNFDND